MKPNKTRTIVVAALLLTLLCVMIAPVSATDLKYAEYDFIFYDGDSHFALAFDADYNPDWHPEVKGTGGPLNFLLFLPWDPNRDPQNWLWVPHNGKSALLIPGRYVICVYNFNYKNDIHIDHDNWLHT